MKKKPPPKLIHVDRLNQYVAEVQSGVRPANKWEKLAVDRHVADLARVVDDDWPYLFDAVDVERRCRRAELWHHTKGRWAAKHQTIKMEGWQCFIMGSIFGWKRKTDKRRRFREAYIECGRKNGKSLTAAAIGLEMFLFDGEYGAEVYAGATSEKQAWYVFEPARRMLMHDEEIRTQMGVTVAAKALVREEDRSTFQPVIGKPGDGASPHCAIADEFHEHITSDLVDTMTTGMLAREQPLMLYVTTAGDNAAGPCYAKRDEVCQMLDQSSPNERLFGIIFTIDETDDWASPDVLLKANPNLGVSFDLEGLLADQRRAKETPVKQAAFKTKHLNVWVGALNGLINIQRWRFLADPALHPSQFAGEDCWFGVDLASTSDLCAVVKLFRKEVNDRPHYYGFLRCYLPEKAIEDTKANHAVYANAIEKGSLVVTPGATCDYDCILDDIDEEARQFNPQKLVFDPFNARHFGELVRQKGIEVVECEQIVKNIAVPTDQLIGIITDGRFHHNGDAFFQWQVGNVVGKTGRKGLMMPAKGQQSHKKIDGFQALVMAMKYAFADEEVGTSGDLVTA